MPLPRPGPACTYDADVAATGVLDEARRGDDDPTQGPGPSRLGTGEGRLRRHLLGRVPSDALWGWVGPLLVTALAFVMRIWHLQHPHKLVFDETYYVKQAYTLWQNGFENQWPEGSDSRFTTGAPDVYLEVGDRAVHPPVGKWMIALGEMAFGIDSSFGWRISAAVVGTLMVLVLARTARRMLRSTLLGCTAGLLLAVDGHHLVLSRTGLLDVFLAFWVLCAFSLLVLDRDVGRRRLAAAVARTRAAGRGVGDLGPWIGVRPVRLLAAVCLGLAIGVKWSGLYFAAAFCLMTVLWDMGARRAAGVRSPWWGMVARDGVPAALLMLPVMALTYLASWTGWMRSDRGYFRNWAAENPSDSAVPDVLRSLWHYHADMLEFHAGLASDHPYESKPWAWLLQSRPTSFFYESPERGEHGCPVDACSEAITSIGNPLIWWAAAASLLVLLACWLLRRDWRAGAILGAFAAGWLPWFLLPERTIYAFYSVAFVAFLVLGLTYVLGLVLGPSDAPPARRRTGAIAVGAFVAVAVLVSAFFWPVWTAETIPYQQWQLRMWFPSWV